MYGDRMEMSHSIEGRTPFLDHKLVECCRNIPVSMKIKGLKEKYIIRESAKKYITRSVYEKQKHPFLAPPAKKNNRHMLNLMRETFQSELDHQPYYDKGKVLSLLNDYSSMNTMDQTATDTALLHVLSVCLLKKRFNASV